MISPDEIADAIKIHRPTPEQRDVIENAPVDGPAAVIAGAGSGKTELMSARVLWLVANNFMTPAQVLGLTFTRKAAKELQLRVVKRLNDLRETTLWPKDLETDFDPPKIATYNSFANEVFRSVSLAIGYESDVPLLGEAGTFLLARKFVDELAFELVPKLAETDRRADSLVELVIALESEMGEHAVTATQLADHIQNIAQFIQSLPKKPGGADFSPFSYTTEMVSPLLETADLAVLAEGFREFKRNSAAVDYSDQLRLAAAALVSRPELADSYRERFKQVLLDEYQDTSSVQVRLLSSLFSGRAVLAVGDPNQSIYGWRGAAAGTMENFGKRFGARPGAVFPLSSNWRSDQKILEVANSVAASLAVSAPDRVAAPLVLTADPSRPEGEVSVQLFEHELEEAEAVAKILAGRVTHETSAAILFRKRKHMARFAAALDQLKVPYEISGLGGLLKIAEVADLVAALRVVADPEAGVALMRLLAGPRWRVGSADLALLHSYAKTLGRLRNQQGSYLPVTLIEALDELAQESPFAAPEFSTETAVRLREAAKLFRVLRRQVNLSLTEYARAIAAELWLDIELMASGRPDPLANLYSFYDLIAEFEQTANEPTLLGFLSWLDHAERKQRLEPPKNGVKRGVVQLLTVHSSKGLEWDIVVVPDLVEGEFPSEERSYRGWLAAGKLPYPLREDCDSLPNFDWQQCDSQKSLKESFNLFRAAVKDHLYAEQGRLAYVAFTRARHSLLLTGSYWAVGGETPREPSRYIELVLSVTEAGVLKPFESKFSDNPYPDVAETQSWPHAIGTELNKTRIAQGESILAMLAVPDLLDIALAADEMNRQRPLSDVLFPTRLSATALAEFLLRPVAFVKRLARPLPAEYIEAADLGTQFHSAVEAWLLAETDEIVGDRAEYFDQLFEQEPVSGLLVDNFLDSEFAGLTPAHVELPVQFVLDGLVINCKLDAVFKTESGLEVVDWKTGSQQEREKMQLQLSIYRLALHKFTGVPLENISAALYFAKDNSTVRLQQLMDEKELIAQLAKARTALLAP